MKKAPHWNTDRSGAYRHPTVLHLLVVCQLENSIPLWLPCQGRQTPRKTSEKDEETRMAETQEEA